MNKGIPLVDIAELFAGREKVAICEVVRFVHEKLAREKYEVSMGRIVRLLERYIGAKYEVKRSGVVIRGCSDAGSVDMAKPDSAGDGDGNNGESGGGVGSNPAWTGISRNGRCSPARPTDNRWG